MQGIHRILTCKSEAAGGGVGTEGSEDVQARPGTEVKCGCYAAGVRGATEARSARIGWLPVGEVA